MKWIKEFFFALTFLTRLPSPIKVEYNEELPSKSMAFYPLVGLIIGIFLVLSDIVLSTFLSTGIANIFILIVWIYLSGGLHLDGFIDSIDGLFSSRKKERMLEIMHDSRVGAFGVIALIILLLLKYNLLLEMPDLLRSGVLLFSPALSRFLIVIIAANFPLAMSSTLGKGFNYHLGLREQFIGAIWLLILMSVLNYFNFNILIFIVLSIISFLFTIIIALYVCRKIDGLTGDIYGAMVELNEVFILLSYIILSNWL